MNRDDVPLFDVPDDAWLIPPPPEDLTRGGRRKRLVARRIVAGVHPLGRPVMLHPDASRDPDNRSDGPRCGGCMFRKLLEHHNRVYPKCWWPGVEQYPHPRDTHCDSSDIRAWWPACQQFRLNDSSRR